MNDPHKNHIQTVRLSAQEKRKLVETIDQDAVQSDVHVERRSMRIAFHHAELEATIRPPAGPPVNYSIVTRNLSRWGIAFLHGQFVYPESTCEMMIPKLDGEIVKVKGAVKRCRHVKGIIHEVSVVFDQPIDLSQFVQLSAEEQMLKEQELEEDGARSERGHRPVALIVDEMKADRRLFCHWLHEAGFESHEAVSAKQAEGQIEREQLDVILVDDNLEEVTGVDFVRQLREKDFKGAIIGTSSNTSDQTKRAFLEAGAEAFLGKPFTSEALVAALSEHCATLTVDAGDAPGEPIVSSLAGNASMTDLLNEFVDGMEEYVARLRQAKTSKDLDQLVKLCQQLKGAGGSYGYDPITQAAELAVEQLHAEQQDAEKINEAVGELIQVLRRVRVK